MKKYGALRKVVFIVVLSILGSYCIASDSRESGSLMDSFGYAMQVAYDAASSVIGYCQKLCSEIVTKVVGVSDKLVQCKEPMTTDQDVIVQMVDDHVNSYRVYCTDDKDDCEYNADFFTDASLTGRVDEDSGSHYEIGDTAITLVEDDPREDMVFNKYSGTYRPIV